MVPQRAEPPGNGIYESEIRAIPKFHSKKEVFVISSLETVSENEVDSWALEIGVKNKKQNRENKIKKGTRFLQFPYK